MRYKASVHLRKADTAGRVPASILDGVVRQELLGQIGTALKPHLTIQQAVVTDELQPAAHADRINFTTELVILPGEQWNQFKEQLSQWCKAHFPAESDNQQTLFETLENP